VFTSKILQNPSSYIDPPPENIILSYAENQTTYDDIKNKLPHVEFVKGLSFSLPENKRNLIIIDDQMTLSVNDKKIHWLFTQGIHHGSTSVIYISQNLYPQGKYSVDIRRNLNYFCIMKSPTFTRSIMDLDRQLFGCSGYLLDSYKNATNSKPYTYLVVDIHPKSNDLLRIQSGIFPGENHIIHLP